MFVVVCVFESSCVLCPALCLQISIWDSFMGWWGSEEVGAIRRRKKPMGAKVTLKPKIKE